MIKQFDNLSSWRKEEVTIKAHDMATVNFRDTMPNVFVIANPNKANLKVGISNLPRVDSYEFKVEFNSMETVGRPIGTHNLYILNDSSLDITITVYSIETDFSPEILKNLNVSIEGASLTASTEISGVAAGVRLPVTDTTIEEKQQTIIDSLINMKAVHISGINSRLDDVLKDATFTNQAAAIKNILNALLTESTFSTNAQSILTKLDTLISGQGSGGGGGGDVSAALLSYFRPPTTATYLNGATEFSYTAAAACRLHFGWLFNDGGMVSTISINGTGVLSLMADERVTDFELELAEGDVVTIASDQSLWRIKYWTY